AVEDDFAFGFCAFATAELAAFAEVFGLGFAVFGLEDDLEEGMEWSDWIKNEDTFHLAYGHGENSQARRNQKA
ncbi:MAG: hypothetical protein ORN83_12845, partial [Chthoniobacteraceae bacterium]|nr:hypothetical protein [Chthoniobacteraceae bacterium]